LFVSGWTGAGKSVALYSLAVAARAAHWVVMYIPSATLMVQGGRFYRSDVEGDAMWDTPEAAKHIIKALVTSHGEALGKIAAPMHANLAGAATLADIAGHGLEASNPRVVVEAAIALKDGLLAHDGSGGLRTAVIIDDYNMLYAGTDYHEPMHAHHRRPIAADELRLASAFRVLEPRGPQASQSVGGTGIAVAAPTFGGRVSPSLRLPRDPGALTLRIPRLDLGEVATVATMLADSAAIPEMPSGDVLRRALALTNGNGKELRELKSALLSEEDPLGLSLGYKALWTAKKRYATSTATT